MRVTVRENHSRPIRVERDDAGHVVLRIGRDDDSNARWAELQPDEARQVAYGLLLNAEGK